MDTKKMVIKSLLFNLSIKAFDVLTTSQQPTSTPTYRGTDRLGLYLCTRNKKKTNYITKQERRQTNWSLHIGQNVD
jgi:hypothetical protein